MLDQKARQAAAHVMSCIRRHISALEAREKELLNSIERARVVKFDSLKMKDERLRIDKTRLTKVTYKLCNILDACDFSSNPKELLAMKDMTMAEVTIDFPARFSCVLCLISLRIPHLRFVTHAKDVSIASIS